MTASTLFIATLVIVGLVVIVLVIYLILIMVALRRAGTHLEKLAGGLQKIADDTEPLSGKLATINGCLLYTSPSPRDQRGSRMPSSA